MTIDNSKSIPDNAYNLWKASTSHNLPHDAPNEKKQLAKIHEIASTLFNTLIKKKWYCRLPLFSRISKRLVLCDVKRALAAYKFDLLTAQTPNTNELWLFKDKEKTLATDLRPIFKRHLLHRTEVKSIRAKAKRWRNKVSKYHDSPRYLLANSALTAATERFPEIKRTINHFVKPMKSSTIKEITNRILDDEDPAVEQGITRLLGREDFNPKAPFSTILKSAIYEIGTQKVKNVARETLQTCTHYLKAARDKASSFAVTLKKVIFYPFITKEG